MHDTTIDSFMTVSPYTIGQDQALAAASRLMREHHIRHLPVLDGGTLVGMLSDRDIALIESVTDADPEKLAVAEAMSTEVYWVDRNAFVTEVASTMADRKFGAAVVMDRERVVGVFTTVDALRLLAGLLRASRNGAGRR